MRMYWETVDDWLSTLFSRYKIIACAPGLVGLSFSARSSFEIGCQSWALSAGTRTVNVRTSPMHVTAILFNMRFTITSPLFLSLRQLLPRSPDSDAGTT